MGVEGHRTGAAFVKGATVEVECAVAQDILVGAGKGRTMVGRFGSNTTSAAEYGG